MGEGEAGRVELAGGGLIRDCPPQAQGLNVARLQRRLQAGWDKRPKPTTRGADGASPSPLRRAEETVGHGENRTPGHWPPGFPRLGPRGPRDPGAHDFQAGFFQEGSPSDPSIAALKLFGQTVGDRTLPSLTLPKQGAIRGPPTGVRGTYASTALAKRLGCPKLAPTRRRRLTSPTPGAPPALWPRYRVRSGGGVWLRTSFGPPNKRPSRGRPSPAPTPAERPQRLGILGAHT